MYKTHKKILWCQMIMQIFKSKTIMNKHILYFSSILLFFFFSCKKDKIDPNLYEVNTVGVQPPGAGKNKLKTNEQYISILYSNLYQKGLSANQLFDISECMQSIGDQEIAKEVVISNFMNKPGVIMPSDVQMRADIGKFIDETYKRFLIRYPTEAEKTYMVNFISTNPNITVELVFFSFAISDEYMYY